MSAPRSRRLPLAITLCCALLLVGGCSSAPFRTVGDDRIALGQAERDLSTGIRADEEGEHPGAAAPPPPPTPTPGSPGRRPAPLAGGRCCGACATRRPGASAGRRDVRRRRRR